MNNSTAWLDCLAFEESGIKAFGCFGKRSAYLMSKEKDGYNNDEHVFEYRTDNEGYIREITVTTYDGQHQVSSKRIHIEKIGFLYFAITTGEASDMIHFDRRSNGFYIIKSTLLAPDILYLKFIL